jgi:N-acyl-D-amino-acid deacylase
VPIDTLIRNASIVDGTGAPAYLGDIAIDEGRIVAIGELSTVEARKVVVADGQTVAPGFIDTHTHDDLAVIADPRLLPKLSQGVTTVVVGNCGISASPVRVGGSYPDPMNLLGEAAEFRYPTFGSYVRAVEQAQPIVNLAALVGHTALRSNHMDRLDRTATSVEIGLMRKELRESLAVGALGLSTGLAYASANSATTQEVHDLCEVLAEFDGIYATHLRSETDQIGAAIDEALEIGRRARAAVVVSHLKCAGIDHWGRSERVLEQLADGKARVGWDCYPYAASSSTLDLRQVDERVTIQITWSQTHPEVGGRTLGEIAVLWGVSHLEAAKRLEPAGAIYHCMSEEDVQTILKNPGTMIGSDGLPCDPRPHPRLWGTFPRVLGHYCRELELFSLPEAVRKMTNLPATRFKLQDRGQIRVGYWADLVLFEPAVVGSRADFVNPVQVAEGIQAVWVNGSLSFWGGEARDGRNGQFLRNVATSLR